MKTIRKFFTAFNLVEWCFIIGAIAVVILARPLNIFPPGWFKNLLKSPIFWIVIGIILLTLIIANRKMLFKKSTGGGEKVKWSGIWKNLGVLATIALVIAAGFYLLASGKLAWSNATKPYENVEDQRAARNAQRQQALSKKPQALNFTPGKILTYYKDVTYKFVLGTGEGDGLSAKLENPHLDYDGLILSFRQVKDPTIGHDATFDKEGRARVYVRKDGLKGGDTVTMNLNKDVRMVTYY